MWLEYPSPSRTIVRRRRLRLPQQTLLDAKAARARAEASARERQTVIVGALKTLLGGVTAANRGAASDGGLQVLMSRCFRLSAAALYAALAKQAKNTARIDLAAKRVGLPDDVDGRNSGPSQSIFCHGQHEVQTGLISAN